MAGESVTGDGIEWGSPAARGVLAATVLGAGLAFLDSTIINVALPGIGEELGASVAGLQWILDGYLLALAALILIAGALCDSYGRRRVFAVGIVWFGVASVLCGLAVSTEMLVAARVLQGVGGALVTPGALAIIQAAFQRRDRARAIGAWSGLTGLSGAVGPVVGGLLVQVWSWRLAFLINVPLAAVALWLVVRYVPDSCDADRGRRPELLGSVLGAVGLAGLTGALVEAPARGPLDPLVASASVLGVAALAAFVVRQLRARDPLVPPGLFADRTFVLANVVSFVVYAALMGVMVLFMLQLQVSLGYSPAASGLAGLPTPALLLVFSALSGRLAQRFGPRWFVVGGAAVVAAGMALMARVSPGATYLGTVLPAILVFGIGLVLVIAPMTATALAAAPDRYAGVASGVNNAIGRTGGLLAVAALPAAAGLTGAAYTDPVALTDGWRTAMWICAGLCLVGGALAVGIRNDVLAGAPADAMVEAPRPGECLHCGVEGPPTHVVPGRR
ncbi:MFS transporter [Pseudonocardia acaciae]|uniref:MFS transporter n=1 Tax=Pseudonocardia acaciae TaxID=551276 RepID=UPI00055C4CFE|nr:MFS transporter [Pseudonocardia acaciae]